MPPINFNYATELSAGTAGMIATTEPTEVISRTNEDATLTPFGRAVFRGSNDKGATKTVATTANAFLGVAMLDRSAYTDELLTVEGFRQYDTIPVLRKGVVWVTTAVAVNDGEPAYVTPGGVFTNVDGGGANAATGGVFETSNSAAGLAQLRLK